MIYIVVGHPRSGTSMMMQALEAGGLPIAKAETRERFRNSDGFKPNEGGFYELEPATMWEPTWPRRFDGMAIKVLTRWVRHLAVHSYRAAFIHRDPEEIRQSFEANMGVGTTCERIELEVLETRRALGNRGDVLDIVSFDYAAVVADPLRELGRLDWPFSTAAAAAKVKKELHHFRRELLHLGI